MGSYWLSLWKKKDLQQNAGQNFKSHFYYALDFQIPVIVFNFLYLYREVGESFIWGIVFVYGNYTSTFVRFMSPNGK